MPNMMENVATDIDALKAMGYVVLQLAPGKWRARGPLDYIDLWFVQRLYRPSHQSGKAIPYDRVFDTVKGHIEPFETMTDEEFRAYLTWKDGLENLTVCYPQMYHWRPV